jgi:hypothetical protein
MKHRNESGVFVETESIYYEPWLEKSHTIERHQKMASIDEIIEKQQEEEIKDQSQLAPPRKITQKEQQMLDKICKTDLEFWVIYLYEGFNRVTVDKNGDIVGQPTYQQIAEFLGIDKNQVKKIVDRVMSRIKRLKK